MKEGEKGQKRGGEKSREPPGDDLAPDLEDGGPCIFIKSQAYI